MNYQNFNFKKMNEKYNGYKNRSTWLSKIHLDNTNLEIYERANAIGIEANTIKEFKNKIKPVLLNCPLLWKEQDFDALEIDFNELWDCFRFSN